MLEAPRRYRVWSETTPGKAYSLWAFAGRAVCGCQGAQFHGHCKHEREILMSAVEQEIMSREEAANGVPSTMALAPIEARPVRSVVLTPGEIQGLMIIAAKAMPAVGHTIPTSIKNVETALSVMLAGAAFGLDPYTSLRHMVVVNGRIEPDAQLMQGICMGFDPSCEFIWKKLTSDVCELEFWRGGKMRIAIEYTAEEAQREGRFVPEHLLPERKKVKSWKNGSNGRSVPDTYFTNEDGSFVMEKVGRGPWHTHRRLMLAYNCVKIVTKLCAPDLLNAIAAQTQAAPVINPADYMVDSPGWAEVVMPEVERARAESAAQRAASTFSGPMRANDKRVYTSAEVKAELERQGVPWVELFAYVGGDEPEAFTAFVASHQSMSLREIVAAAHLVASADPESGELPLDAAFVDVSDDEPLPLDYGDGEPAGEGRLL